MRLRSVILLVVALGAVVAGGLALWRLGALERVEQWCGKQLLAIANDHLEPEVTFERFRYVPPKTLQVTGLSITSGDTRIIEAASATIGFAGIPKPGEPIVIRSIALERPVVRLIRLEEGGILGFSRFVTPTPGRTLPDGGSTRLSDVLAIMTIDVGDGVVEYDSPRLPPMRLEPITFALANDHANEEQGWYAFDAVFQFDPVAELDITARLSLDTGALDVESAVLRTMLGPDGYRIFPPIAQAFLERHQIAGELEVTASGTLDSSRLAASDLRFETLLEDASITLGEYIAPVERLHALGGLSDGVLHVPTAELLVWGGRTEIRALMLLDSGQFSVSGEGHALRIEHALKPVPGETPRLAGKLDFNAEVSALLDDLAGSLGGSGRIAVDEGRLLRMRLIRDVVAKADGANGGKATDRGVVDVALSGDRATFSNLRLIAGALGLRGGGDILFDGGLDLRLSAGPLERLDGPIAKLFTSLTGRLVSYQVSGTIAEPKVSVVTLGVGGG